LEKVLGEHHLRPPDGSPVRLPLWPVRQIRDPCGCRRGRRRSRAEIAGDHPLKADAACRFVLTAPRRISFDGRLAFCVADDQIRPVPATNLPLYGPCRDCVGHAFAALDRLLARHVRPTPDVSTAHSRSQHWASAGWPHWLTCGRSAGGSPASKVSFASRQVTFVPISTFVHPLQYLVACSQSQGTHQGGFPCPAAGSLANVHKYQQRNRDRCGDVYCLQSPIQVNCSPRRENTPPPFRLTPALGRLR